MYRRHHRRFALPPPVCRWSAEKQTTVTWFLVPSWLGHWFVVVWSDGLLWVKFLDRWVWAGNLKHIVYVVLLSSMDCVRRYWLSKQDIFALYLLPHSISLRDFEPRSCSQSFHAASRVYFEFWKKRIWLEFRECALDFEQYSIWVWAVGAQVDGWVFTNHITRWAQAMMTKEGGKQVLLRCVEGLRVGARWLYAPPLSLICIQDVN